MNTTFGCIPLGHIAAQGTNHSTTLTGTTIERDLAYQLKQFWEQKQVSEISVLTQEEQEYTDA